MMYALLSRKNKITLTLHIQYNTSIVRKKIGC